MNRIEALRILGLDEDATADDIKTAYKESAQILHPDRFATNKKLQERATEQFKTLQEAYEFLTSGKGSRGSSRTAAGSASTATSQGYTTASQLEARLAGIAAARTQLVAQRDAVLDERRNGLIMCGLGLAASILLRRVPIAIALGGAAFVWGLIQTISSLSTLSNLDEHIKALTVEQRRLAQELDDL